MRAINGFSGNVNIWHKWSDVHCWSLRFDFLNLFKWSMSENTSHLSSTLNLSEPMFYLSDQSFAITISVWMKMTFLVAHSCFFKTQLRYYYFIFNYKQTLSFKFQSVQWGQTLTYTKCCSKTPLKIQRKKPYHEYISISTLVGAYPSWHWEKGRYTLAGSQSHHRTDIL